MITISKLAEEKLVMIIALTIFSGDEWTIIFRRGYSNREETFPSQTHLNIGRMAHRHFPHKLNYLGTVLTYSKIMKKQSNV